MENDGYDAVKHYIQTGQLDPRSATQTREKAIERLRRGMPDGRVEIVLHLPDPDDPFGDQDKGWATETRLSSDRALAPEHVYAKPTIDEQGRLYDVLVGKQILLSTESDEVGVENFDSMGVVFEAAFDTAMRLTTGNEASELDWFDSLRSLLIQAAREHGMPKVTVLSDVGHSYEDLAEQEGEE
jgi:hypothetical protein